MNPFKVSILTVLGAVACWSTVQAQTTTQAEIAAQELQLKEKVQETQDRLNMQLEGDVLFDVNKAIIKDSAIPKLRQVALILMEYPKGEVIVTGYADSTGSPEINVPLSRTRAEAVKTYLLEKSGVSSERVIARGLGEEQPAASNATAAGRELNRRVEISVSKLAP
jgi:outer membrane protein OmpA-like peptidoglycan-associated protein